MSIEFSFEQKEIGRVVGLGHNVIVDAVAGSGKTTTIRYIGECVKGQVLVILYNRHLAQESKEKIKDLENVEIYTIHGVGQRFYGVKCNVDSGLSSIISNEKSLLVEKEYSVLVVDEIQDLNELMASFILKLLKDLGNCQLVMMGDCRQCIYQFKGSDAKYLSKADEIFSDKREWKRLTLSTSYRCSNGVAQVINSLYSEHIMKGKREGERPQYVICNSFKVGAYILGLIEKWKAKGYCEGDIAVIAPSIKSERSPICKLANYLSSKGYKIFKSTDGIDKELQEGKITFSTIHGFKGREREMVILFNFDDSFFRFYSFNEKEGTFPNRLYVGITRARKEMIVLHHYTNDYLKCLKRESLEELFNVIELKPPLRDPKPFFSMEPLKISVSDLTKFLPRHSLLSLPKYLCKRVEPSEEDRIEIQSILKFNEHNEDVLPIYNTAIPFIKYRELGLVKLSDLITEIVRRALEIEGIEPHINRAREVIRKDDFSLADLAFICNLYNCSMDGYVYPLNQITNYQWFEENKEKILKAVERINFVPNKIRVPVEYIMDERYIWGTLDAIDKDGNLWMVKCSDIQDEDILELAIYTGIYSLKEQKIFSCSIINILTKETVSVEFKDLEMARNLLHSLIEIKKTMR